MQTNNVKSENLKLGELVGNHHYAGRYVATVETPGGVGAIVQTAPLGLTTDFQMVTPANRLTSGYVANEIIAPQIFTLIERALYLGVPLDMLRELFERELQTATLEPMGGDTVDRA